MDNKTILMLDKMLTENRNRATFINDSRKRTTFIREGDELTYIVVANHSVGGTARTQITVEYAQSEIERYKKRRTEVLDFVGGAFDVDIGENQVKRYSGSVFTLEFMYAGTLEEILDGFINVQRIVHVTEQGDGCFTVVSDGQTLTMEKYGRVLRVQI